MTSYTWNGVSGHWRTASDWSPAGGPPTASDSATIDGSGTYTVTVRLRDFASSLTLSDPNATLNDEDAHASLTIGGALTISDGTLNISPSDDGGVLTVGALSLSGGALTIGASGGLNLDGTLSQTGGTLSLEGTISGGTIDSTAGTLNIQSGTLSSVTFDGPLNLTTTSEETVYLANGTTVVGSSGSGPGTINDTGANSFLEFDNTQTFSSATINLGNPGYWDYLSEYDTAGAGGQVLTLASNVTVDVQGFAVISASSASGDGIVNQGTIDLTSDKSALSIEANAFTNSGTIDAEGTSGSLDIEPTATFTNSGTIDVANGEIAVIESTVTGNGTETVSGGSTLEFVAGVSSAKTLGDQDIDFAGAGLLHLFDPASFYGEISDFGSRDTVELRGSWAFSAISQASGVTTLTLARGSTTHGFEFVGDYAQGDFTITPGKTTTIGFA
jgi:hypothetical protein